MRVPEGRRESAQRAVLKNILWSQRNTLSCNKQWIGFRNNGYYFIEYQNGTKKDRGYICSIDTGYPFIEYEVSNSQRKRAYIANSNLRNATTNYTYGKAAASNGVVLQYIKTTPDKVRPHFFSSNLAVPNWGEIGANG